MSRHPCEPTVTKNARLPGLWFIAAAPVALGAFASPALGNPAKVSFEPFDADPCRLEVFNGQVRAIRAIAGGNCTVASDGTWTLPGDGQGGIEVDLLMAAQRDGDSSDATVVTVRSKFRSFSFAAEEVAAGGRILVDDLGVLVVRGDDPATLDGCRAALREYPDRSVYDRVFAMPEQTLGRAWNDMPLKHPLWFVHGLPGNRNAIRHDSNGGIAIAGYGQTFAIDRSPRDSDRKLWDGGMLGVEFGFPADSLRAGRELHEGYLPLLRTWWVDGPLYYEERAILDKLDGNLVEVRLDDPTVLLVKVRVVNTSATETAKAGLRLSTHAAGGETLYLDDDLVLARHEGGGRLIDKSKAATANGYLLDTYPGNSLRSIVEAGTLGHDAKLASGQWIHVAATFDPTADRQCLYMGGRLVAERGKEPAEPGTEDDASAELSPLTRGYLLQRLINACGGRGAYPIKFNGSIFTVDAVDGGQHCDADYRRWGGCYWFQNTRLPYWAMLYAGDFDLMQPLFRMYREALPLARERTRKYYGHAGAFFPETMYFWGTYNNDNYGWNRPGKPDGLTDNTYIRYYWDGALELLAMMLDYYALTGDERLVGDTLVPLAQETLAFYSEHYPKRDAQGKIVFEPSQALETWHDATNPLPVVAGLQYVSGRLLNEVPAELAGEARAQWQRLRELLPDVPMQTSDGPPRLLPAQRFERLANSENPERYAVFPYRLYGLGQPDLEIGRATFDARRVKRTGGWSQDPIQAALLGLTDVAAAYTYQNFSTSHGGSRFPAFWGPNFDWVPDQDHGGVSMIALHRMLMQCDGDRILLLPAWPREWNVDFRLCAPQQTTVRAVWRDGKLATLEVAPERRLRDVIAPQTK